MGDDTSRTQDFQLQPSQAVAGVVLDATGRPAAKAEVLLGTPAENAGFGEHGMLSGSHKVTTDASGRFTFPDPGGPFIVLAGNGAGFAEAEFAASPHDNCVLRLQAWASIRGQYRDGDRPVRDALILLQPIRLNSLQRPKMPAGLPTRTDADGRFEFVQVPPLAVSISVSLGPDWESRRLGSWPSVPLDLQPGQQAEVILGAGTVVKGKVKLTGKVRAGLDCTNSLSFLVRRAPGITVPPTIAGRGFDIRKGWKTAWFTTAEGLTYLSTLQHWVVKLAPDGAFQISGVPSGEYDLAIEIYASRDVGVGPVAEKVVPVTVTAADAAGGELALPEISATVVPAVAPATGTKVEQPKGNAATDVSGTSVAGQIVEPPPPAKPAEDVVRATNVAVAKTVTPAKTVHGKVVDEKGEPIADADVWMTTWDPADWRPPTHATSNTEGRFILPVGPCDPDAEVSSSYQPGMLWAYATGYQLGTGQSGNQLAGIDKSDVVIRLGQAVDRPFVVLGPDGQPRAGALVEPNEYSAWTIPKEVRSHIALRTAPGASSRRGVRRDELRSVCVITQDLGIQTQGLGEEIIPHGWLGVLPEGQPIRLRQGGRIVGHVTAEKPEWTRGVRIFLNTASQTPQFLPPRHPQHGAETPSWTHGFADVVSNEKGEFLVPAMAAGELTFDAYVDPKLPVLPRIPDYTDFTGHRAVYVRPGETTKLEIPLVRAVAVHGSVVAKETGRPIAARLIQIGYGPKFVRSLYRLSDAQGKFAASVLPGRIQIWAIGPPSALLPPDGHIQFGASPEYEVPENVREFNAPPLVLVPTKSIAGRLIDEHDRPVANMAGWIQLGDWCHGYLQSNAKGEFTLKGVATTIDMAKGVIYQASLWNGKSEEMDATVVQAAPLVLRLQRPDRSP